MEKFNRNQILFQLLIFYTFMSITKTMHYRILIFLFLLLVSSGSSIKDYKQSYESFTNSLVTYSQKSDKSLVFKKCLQFQNTRSSYFSRSRKLRKPKGIEEKQILAVPHYSTVFIISENNGETRYVSSSLKTHFSFCSGRGPPCRLNSAFINTV